MGYRSEVYIKVDIKHKKQLIQKLIERDMHDWGEFFEQDEYFGFQIDDVKWYQGYPDVDAINNFINDDEILGGLIAVGEDGMTEHYGEPYAVGLETYTVVEGNEDTSNFDFSEFRKENPELFL